jgi:hypothetical protein
MDTYDKASVPTDAELDEMREVERLRKENAALKADIAARKEIMADDFQQIHRLKLELLASRNLTGIAEQQTTRVIDERDALKAEVERLTPEPGNEHEDDEVALFGIETAARNNTANPEILDESFAYVRSRMAVARKAEAELTALRSEADAARPLIQQVEDTIDAYGNDPVLGEAVASLDDALAAYREGKEKG